MLKVRTVTVAVMASLALLSGAAACTSGHTPESRHSPLSQSAQNDPTAVLNQGLRQASARDFDAARASFQRVITLDKNNKYAWYNLGVIAQTANSTDEAVKDYDAALAIDPNFTSALYNKAIVVEPSNVDAAIDLYRKVLAVNKSASTTYLRLGLLLDRKGDHNGARDNFRQAVTLDQTLLNAVPQSYRSGLPGS
jgi:tetratricopeptide (TPR) repeat protein